MKNLADIENEMRHEASDVSFEFKESFWDEMSNDLEGSVASSHGVDETLSSSSEQQAFTYKESFWAEMSALLDKRDRRKAFALFSSVAAVAALVIGLGIYSIQTESVFANFTLIGQNSDFNWNELRTESASDSESKTTSNQNLSFDYSQSSPSEKVINNSNSSDFTAQSSTRPNNNLVDIETREIPQDVVSNQESNKKTDVQNSNAVNESELSITKVNIDNLSTEIESPSSLIVLPKTSGRTGSSGLFLNAGAMITNAPVGNVKDRKYIGFGFRGGIGYSYVKNNWGLETGVNFLVRNAINHQTCEVQKIYGSRLYEIEQKSNYKNMMSLEIPLLATYSINKHRIGLGASGVYNFALQSTLTESNLQEDTEVLVRNNYGVRDGITPFDLRLQLNYQYQLNKKFSVGLNAQFGLVNQIDRSVIADSKGYRDINATVFLKYNIFKF